jgi:hypothetical protein
MLFTGGSAIGAKNVKNKRYCLQIRRIPPKKEQAIPFVRTKVGKSSKKEEIYFFVM